MPDERRTGVTVPPTLRRPAADRTRSVIVHDFFIQDGGAERCAVEFAKLLPDARIVTSFFDASRFTDRIDLRRVHSWPLQRLVGPTPHFRSLLPLYPLWFSALDLRDQQLVISSSSAFAKAARTRGQGCLHVAYVYTPMRFAWDLDRYLADSSLKTPARLGARMAGPLLRQWDRMTSNRPDVLVAISETVRARIRRVWGRESQVIYPPVDTDAIRVSLRDDGYLLVAARLLAYRRLDLAVEAAKRLDVPLVVVGDGPESARLRKLAGPSTRFLGHVDRLTLLDLIAGCRAYLVPGPEDFGIAPVEAMAAGKPVVAYREGGATETIIENETGVFFDEPDPDALADGICRAMARSWDVAALRSRAEAFAAPVFRRRWRELLAGLGVDPNLYSQER